MTPAKVSVRLVLFAYGGNGGVSSIIPQLAIWVAQAIAKLKADHRVDRVGWEIYSDTPITMTRNRAIREAREQGFDMVLMLDSDNEPDAYVGADPEAKPFLDVAFPFAYDRLMQGKPTVIAAPYCGPPPNPVPKPGVTDHGEVPYLFNWTNNESDSPDCRFEISILTRLEASRLRGIYPVAALPTGVCLFTLNAFEGLPIPYFKYEFNADHSEKLSTEDVVATRDISLFWQATKGWEVIYAACDSWALHYKPKKVGKPKIVMLESIAGDFREAILANRSGLDTQQHIDYTANLPRRGQILSHDQNEIYISDEELEQARVLSERIESTGTDVADVRLPEEWESARAAVDAEFPPDDDSSDIPDTDIDEDDGEGYDPVRDNGHPAPTAGITYRMISGRRVAVHEGHWIPDESLDSLRALVEFTLENRANAPLDVAVIHSGTGQSAAAIEAMLPDGSHLHALDSIMVHGFNQEPSQQFEKSFAEELEIGRVMADHKGRKFPRPDGRYDLDFVFIEGFVKGSKVSDWLEHVTRDGVLAGLGYSKTKVKKLVDAAALAEGFRVQSEGDVWAIQVKVESNVGR